MGRRQTDSELGRCALLIIFLVGTISCGMVYLCLSLLFKPINTTTFPGSNLHENGVQKDVESEENEECCRGIEHFELWGDAVKWGSVFKVNSSEECCMACKEMCKSQNESGDCLCDTWVFCGNMEACGPRFGECWLKRQKDTLGPEEAGSGEHVPWTSGIIFGKDKGIVGLKTEYGIIRIKLFPDCAPHSVNYILQLLALHHCSGCHFYRAETRGSYWDSEGNHVENAPYGPPFALIQGTLEARGAIFKEISMDVSQTVRRGSIAWVSSGPEFFISLANHIEWKRSYTVFGSVLVEDMGIVEKIAQLPTQHELWSNIDVSVLEKPVSLKFQTIKKRLAVSWQ